MPLVRIDVPAATSAADRRAAADVVHDALVATFNVPPADRFQLIAEHRDGELICTSEYLGVPHSANVVFVQITCSEGRSVATKRALYERIAAEMPKRSNSPSNFSSGNAATLMCATLPGFILPA